MKPGLLLLLIAGLLCGCSARETVVVYSAHGPDVLRDYEALFEAAHPGIDLQWLDMGSQEIYNRIRAEQRRPHGDVWWGGPADMFAEAAEQDLLAAYRPSWAAQADPVARDPDDRWYGTYGSPIGIVFNTHGVQAAEVPQSWDELLDPAWHGRIVLRKPQASGTMRTFIAAMGRRAPTADAGRDWLARLHAATESYPESPQLLYDRLKRNPHLITVWLVPDAVLQRERNGYPFGFTIPAETPVITEGIALIKGAPHAENARLFYEFVTTTEALAHQARAYAKMPLRADIPPEALPEWMRARAFTPMDLGGAAAAEQIRVWMNRWETEVYRDK